MRAVGDAVSWLSTLVVHLVRDDGCTEAVIVEVMVVPDCEDCEGVDRVGRPGAPGLSLSRGNVPGAA